MKKIMKMIKMMIWRIMFRFGDTTKMKISSIRVGNPQEVEFLIRIPNSFYCRITQILVGNIIPELIAK